MPEPYRNVYSWVWPAAVLHRLRRILVVSTAYTAGVYFLFPNTHAAEIGWLTSFDGAKSSAQPGQVIFVDVYTDWCGWCKYMDQRVYTHSDVKQFAADNVFVRLDAEDGAEGTKFARQNGVNGYPGLLVFSSDGTLIDKQLGAFRDPRQFMAWLRENSR